MMDVVPSELRTSKFCAFFTCSEDGNILSCNERLLELLHLDSHEAARKSNFFAFFPTGKATRSFLAAIRATDCLEEAEVRLCPAGHPPLWARLHVRTQQAHNGQLAGFDVEMIDITRERELREQLMRAQKLSALGQLTGGVAHDFNNLLAIIIGYSDLILEEVEAHPRLQPLLVEVSRAAERGARMTRQLLAFSRQRGSSLTTVDVAETLQDLEKMLRRLIGEEIALDLQCAADLPPVKADVGQLEQIIMNLVVNARDAIDAQGHITIRAAVQDVLAPLAGCPDEVKAGRYVIISVEDSGHGMEETVLPRIFEPFFTTKQDNGGTGLGLATCREIMQRFNGHMQVTSEPGKGTVFQLYLLVAEEKGAGKTDQRLPMKAMRGNETILVVEDDELVRDVIVRVLTVNGYHVLQAPDAHTANRLLRESTRPIHLLLVDVVLPDTMGPDLAASVTAETPDIQVLFMSGYADRAAEKYGLLKDSGNFLPKPFSAVELVSKLRETLDHRAQHTR